jgi:6-phosphogluconolactonase
LVDERIVETLHQDSNENLLKTHLLKNNAKNAKFIGLVNTDLSIDDMLSNANSNISSIDLAILGMGDDGHTASIFPDCAELNYALDNNNQNNYIVTNPQSAKYSRITLTLRALVNIPVLILSINGNTKLNVLKEANIGDNLNYPVSYVLSRRPDTQTFWYE